MKNTSRKHYIYKVTNRGTNQYYIGSQCRGKIIGVNYFTSSTNKEFKDDFKTYGEEKYKIEIIKEFEDPEECVRVENYIIKNHMQLKDGLCLNRAYFCNGEKIFSAVGIHHAPWNKGIPHSKETRKRMSLAQKGQSPSKETRKRMSLAHKIKISIKGITFESITEASKYYNTSHSTIRYWLKNKKHNAFYIEK